MSDQPIKPNDITTAYSNQAHANNPVIDISYKSGGQSVADTKGLTDEHLSSQGSGGQFFGSESADKSNQDQPDKLESK